MSLLIQLVLLACVLVPAVVCFIAGFHFGRHG
jgi:hypothetical protein